MSGRSDSETDSVPFGALWLAGLIFLLTTIAVWVFFYVHYGEGGQLTPSETTIVALVIALIVFGGRWCILRFARKPKADASDGGK